MLDLFLRQPTKDAFGPIPIEGGSGRQGLLYRFHDQFSILNWGRMPDSIPDRGRVSSRVFVSLNERYRDPGSWKSFLRSPEALSFRKAGASLSQGGQVSAVLNGLSDHLPVPSNYRGVMDEESFLKLGSGAVISGNLEGRSWDEGVKLFPVAEFFPEVRPIQSLVLGRSGLDYAPWREATGPKLLPFELDCHFVLNADSFSNLKTDSISIPKTASLHLLQVGAEFDFPLIEMVLSHDPCGRKISASEALAVSGLSGPVLQEILLNAAWIAAWVRHQIRSMKLQSVRLRFGFDGDGGLVLVDAFEPDDLVLEKDGRRLHPDGLLGYYSKTSWYDGVLRARRQALEFGLTDWKRLCVEPAPLLDPAVKAGFENGYRALNLICEGRT